MGANNKKQMAGLFRRSIFFHPQGGTSTHVPPPYTRLLNITHMITYCVSDVKWEICKKNYSRHLFEGNRFVSWSLSITMSTSDH